MIIGYNFFGLEEGAVFDTPICTEMLDQVRLNEGTYDEIYIDLNTTIPDTIDKPNIWTIQTIMDAKFTGDLDAGSLGAEGFTITSIQVYRSVYGSDNWELIAEFPYDEEYNVYDFVDRYVQNATTYRYAIVPVANEILGEMLLSETVEVKYEGIFLTDRKENRRLEYDIQLGEVSYNNNAVSNVSLNGVYPIVVMGNSNYRTGQLSTLPLSKETVALNGNGIDKLQEQINRDKWIDFLNNHKAKVLRMDSGVLILVLTQNPRVTHKDSEFLRDLASISFDYMEIGKLDFGTMTGHDLISSASLSKFTFNDEGEVVQV